MTKSGVPASARVLQRTSSTARSDENCSPVPYSIFDGKSFDSSSLAFASPAWGGDSRVLNMAPLPQHLGEAAQPPPTPTFPMQYSQLQYIDQQRRDSADAAAAAADDDAMDVSGEDDSLPLPWQADAATPRCNADSFASSAGRCYTGPQSLGERAGAISPISHVRSPRSVERRRSSRHSQSWSPMCGGERLHGLVRDNGSCSDDEDESNRSREMQDAREEVEERGEVDGAAEQSLIEPHAVARLSFSPRCGSSISSGSTGSCSARSPSGLYAMTPTSSSTPSRSTSLAVSLGLRQSALRHSAHSAQTPFARNLNSSSSSPYPSAAAAGAADSSACTPMPMSQDCPDSGNGVLDSNSTGVDSGGSSSNISSSSRWSSGGEQLSRRSSSSGDIAGAASYRYMPEPYGWSEAAARGGFCPTPISCANGGSSSSSLSRNNSVLATPLAAASAGQHGASTHCGKALTQQQQQLDSAAAAVGATPARPTAAAAAAQRGVLTGRDGLGTPPTAFQRPQPVYRGRPSFGSSTNFSAVCGTPARGGLLLSTPDGAADVTLNACYSGYTGAVQHSTTTSSSSRRNSNSSDVYAAAAAAAAAPLNSAAAIAAAAAPLSADRNTSSSSSSSSSALNRSLPIPDQGAFEAAGGAALRRTNAAQYPGVGRAASAAAMTPHKSLVGADYAGGLLLAPGSTPQKGGSECPPTPERTPAWWAHAALSAVGGGAPLSRRSSLQACKVLASSQPLAAAAGTGTGTAAVQDARGGSPCFHTDFTNLGRIGEGAFAVVMRARWRVDGKLYAVKKSKRVFRSKRDRDHSLQEVLALQKLSSCCYVVHFERAWQEEGYFYSQTELCELGNLKELIDTLAPRAAGGDALPDASVWKVLHDTASGLQHIHSHGLVHLDIKPSNIFLSASGCLKIGDFGMATTAFGSGGSSSSEGQEGDTLYMARELLHSSERHPSADMFSLGITLYEVATGAHLPYDGADWHALREGRAPQCSPPRAPVLAAVIAALMAPAAEARPTAAAVKAHPCVAAVEQSGAAVQDAFLMQHAVHALEVPAPVYRSMSYDATVGAAMSQQQQHMLLLQGSGGISTPIGTPTGHQLRYSSTAASPSYAVHHLPPTFARS
jgi:membrane-associated tyrosine- and threonine-specific cdc2-inhibitory kinase